MVTKAAAEAQCWHQKQATQNDLKLSCENVDRGAVLTAGRVVVLEAVN